MLDESPKPLVEMVAGVDRALAAYPLSRHNRMMAQGIHGFAARFKR